MSDYKRPFWITAIATIIIVLPFHTGNVQTTYGFYYIPGGLSDDLQIYEDSSLEVSSTYAAKQDQGFPGCTRINPSGNVFGLDANACSDLLEDLNCSLVPTSKDFIDQGKYKGESFTYDLECHKTNGNPQIYHYKTTEVTYKAGINGYDGTQDTFIRPDHPDSVMPENVAMEVGARTGGIPWIRGVVLFAEQEPLPANAQVVEVTLTMVCQEAVPVGGVPGHLAGGGMNVGVYGLLKEFIETEATWNAYASGSNWEVAGAEGATDRFISADDVKFIGTKCNGDESLPPEAAIVPTPYDWDVTSSYLAQKALGKEEYGWVFFTTESDEDGVRFFTHEMSEEYAPQLHLKYFEHSP